MSFRFVRSSMLVLAFLCVSHSFAQTKLVVASFYPVDQVSGWTGLVEAFKAEHPDVDVEVQVTAGDQYLPKLLSQMVSGDAPDIVAVENNPFPQFVQRGVLADLTPYLESTQGFTLEDFFPFLLERYTVDGKVYGIPYDAQPFALLYYNPKIFDEAGVPYPTSEWTWQDALAAAQKLTVMDGDAVSRYGWDVDDLTGNWTYFLYTGGGSLVDDPKTPTRSELASPEAAEAVQFATDLMHKYKVTPTPQTMEATGPGASNSFFLSGKTAMMVGGFWRAVENAQAFKDMGVRMVLAPVKNPEQRVYGTGGTAYGVTAASKNKDLAWEFITEFLGPEGYKQAYASATLGAIYPPAHIPSYDWYASQPLEFIDTIEPNKGALEFIRFSPFLGDWTEIASKCITSDISLVLRNELPAESTLSSVASCIDGELAQ